MTALLWFHAQDERFTERDREPQLEGTQCQGGGINPISGERDAFECDVHGQRLYYVQRRAERTVDSPLRDHADALGDVVNSGPSYAGMMQSAASNSNVVHDFGYMSLPVEVQQDIESKMAFSPPELQEELQRERVAVALEQRADMRQVGWYCAGEHERESRRRPGLMVKVKSATLVMTDEPQCDHAVPAYVLVKKAEPVDYSNDHPDPNFVRNTVGELVRVTTHDGQELLGHLVTYGGLPPQGIDPLYIEMDRVAGTPVNSPTIHIEWSNLRTCEPA